MDKIFKQGLFIFIFLIISTWVFAGGNKEKGMEISVRGSIGGMNVFSAYDEGITNNYAMSTEYYARGVIAEAAGSYVEALLNFTQSVTFNPSQMAAVSSLSALSSNISEGTISRRIRDDFDAYDKWIAAFKQTAKFFNEHPPFVITFDPNLVQEGLSDTSMRAENLAMRIALDPSETGFSALNVLLEGLEKTGRRAHWGVSGWPFLDDDLKTPGIVVFNGRRTFSFKVDVSLLNENNKTISKSSITLNTGEISFSPGDRIIYPPSGDIGLIRFPNVKREDITASLTIAITAVNGISSAKINSTEYMKIDTGDLERKTALSLLPSPDFEAENPITLRWREEIEELESRQTEEGVSTGEISGAYQDMVNEKGESAVIYEVNMVRIIRNIFGQGMAGAALVGIEMDGIKGFNPETDAVMIVSYTAPEFFTIKVGSRLLLQSPIVVRNSESLEAQGYKTTVVFQITDSEIGDVSERPRFIRTGINSLQGDEIQREIRSAGGRMDEYESPYIFDFNPKNRMGLNIIENAILAVDEIPVYYIRLNKEQIDMKARIRLSGSRRQ